MSDLVITRQRWPHRTVKMIDGAAWRCQLCGWLGEYHFHVDCALREGMLHMKQAHPELETVDVEAAGD